MTLSLQEISDRLEIQDLVFEYSDIVDQKRFEALRKIFTEDGYIDYRGTGGIDGNIEEIIGFLTQSFVFFPDHQHLNGNVQIKIEGDAATARVMCLNPMSLKTEEGVHTFFIGLWYNDKLLRTESGWRFTERIQQGSWSFNTPPGISGGAK